MQSLISEQARKVAVQCTHYYCKVHEKNLDDFRPFKQFLGGKMLSSIDNVVDHNNNIIRAAVAASALCTRRKTIPKTKEIGPNVGGSSWVLRMYSDASPKRAKWIPPRHPSITIGQYTYKPKIENDTSVWPWRLEASWSVCVSPHIVQFRIRTFHKEEFLHFSTLHSSYSIFERVLNCAGCGSSPTPAASARRLYKLISFFFRVRKEEKTLIMGTRRED